MKKVKRKVIYKGITYQSIAECVRQNEELTGMYCFIKKYSRTFSTVDEILNYRQNKIHTYANGYRIDKRVSGPSIIMDENYIERNRADYDRAIRQLKHEQQAGIAQRQQEDKQSREYFRARGV